MVLALICYLLVLFSPFKGVYATLPGDPFNVSSMNTSNEYATVICPPAASNVTECWYNETKRDRREKSIGVACCSGITDLLIPERGYHGNTCIMAIYSYMFTA